MFLGVFRAEKARLSLRCCCLYQVWKNLRSTAFSKVFCLISLMTSSYFDETSPILKIFADLIEL